MTRAAVPVAESIDAYVATVAALARRRGHIAALREALRKRMDTSNPFATATVLPRVERAFERMRERAVAGLTPEDFDVA